VSPPNVTVRVFEPSVEPETAGIEQLATPAASVTPLHDCVPSVNVSV